MHRETNELRPFLVPDEILLHVLSFLPPASILTASLVSKDWYRLAKDESLWRCLCLNRWRIIRPELFLNWKNMYLKRSSQERHQANRLLIFCPWTLELLTCKPDGSDTVLIAEQASADEMHRAQATWDPFSNAIVWSEASEEGCYICIHRDGETLRLKTPFAPFYFYFTPDGTRVAYLGNGTVRSTLTLRLLDVANPHHHDTLIGYGRPYFFCWAPHLPCSLLAHTGGNKVSLIRLTAQQEEQRTLSLSSEAFGSQSVNALTGQREETLLHIKSSNAFCAPVWSPSGNKLIYAVEQEDGKIVIFICRSDGSVQKKIENITGHTRISLSRDEQLLAYTQETQFGIHTPMTIGSLFVYDFRTEKSTEISREPVLAFFFSPNSRYLLWMHYALPSCVSWSIKDFHAEPNALIRFDHAFMPTNTLLREYLFFFDQYAHSMTLFSPDCTSFVYAAMPLGIWVQRIAEGVKAVKVHHQGGFASWSPT